MKTLREMREKIDQLAIPEEKRERGEKKDHREPS
jgi:hypothetical protein